MEELIYSQIMIEPILEVVKIRYEDLEAFFYRFSGIIINNGS